jgi:hypothetical protein
MPPFSPTASDSTSFAVAGSESLNPFYHFGRRFGAERII